MLPQEYRPQHEREDLLALLQLCAARASERHQPQLLSITLRVRHIDPLAVLQAVQNPKNWHAYFENPASDTAIAGIDAAIQAQFNGASRFIQARDFAKNILENTLSVGHTDAPFAGPHFFCGFPFEENSHDGAFASANIFLPCWQVACHDGTYTAVANVLVDENTPLGTTADRILAAHKKYQHFEYDVGEMRSEHNEADNFPNREPRAPLPLQELGGDWYADGVRRALEKIAHGTAQKIVLARTFRVASSLPISLPRTLERLRERFPACHTFSFSTGNGATFIGATPERLATVSHNELHTEAIAGTNPRGTHASDDARLGAKLIESEKDQREHAAVAATIIARLAAIGIAAKPNSEPRLFQLSNVQHLRTAITGALPETIHLLDVAAALHPTPAVGGVPNAAALAAIAEIEPTPRGMYAGTVGWFDASSNGRILVGLRSALVNGTTATLFAGAGIVEGSTPSQELEETRAKLRAMHEALG